MYAGIRIGLDIRRNLSFWKMIKSLRYILYTFSMFRFIALVFVVSVVFI